MSRATPFRVIEERTDGDVTVYTVIVPENCPFFEGHFPGRPVLPAIGQLAMLAELVRRRADSEVSLAGVDDLRLSHQVQPGDQVEVRMESLQAGTTASFEIRCDGASVSSGTLRFATDAGR